MSARPLPRVVAVLGAGTMGSGIALAFARHGVEVRLNSRRESTLAAALERIGGEDGRIATTTSLPDAVAGARLVVETVAEDLGTKHEVLAAAEAGVDGSAILATCTSSFSIGELAGPLARPERFAGFHWFNPPELVDLVEVISGPLTAPETARALHDWAADIGKTPILVRRDIEGFIANRLQYALLREAFALVESGACGYAEVDRAITTALGPRWAAVGPFESMDLAGLDVHETVARRLYPALSTDTEPAPSVRRLVLEGALGCKTGRGLYGEYDAARIERLVNRRAAVLAALAGMEHDEPAPAR